MIRPLSAKVGALAASFPSARNFMTRGREGPPSNMHGRFIATGFPRKGLSGSVILLDASSIPLNTKEYELEGEAEEPMMRCCHVPTRVPDSGPPGMLGGS